MKERKSDQIMSPRPEVLNAPAVPHGAPDYEELESLGLAPEDVLDFSVNGNPYGPPPGVREALQDVPLDRYPDRDALALRRALSEHLGVPTGSIMAGNGTAELIWLIALAFVRPDDRVLVLGPTFGEYARAVALMGARVDTWRAKPESDFVIERQEIVQRLQRSQPRLVFLCNPNNPTGAAVATDVIESWADDHPETLFVVDEAYLSFAASGPQASTPGLRSTSGLEIENVATLRSMTKDYALAGLRLGYVVADSAVIDALVRVRPPWNVNAMAQAAGVAAVAEGDYVRQCMTRLQHAKVHFQQAIRDLSLEPVPSATHFFLVPVGDAAPDAHTLRQQLLRRKVQVRDCTSFDLPRHIRIATLLPGENLRLLEALREVLE